MEHEKSEGRNSASLSDRGSSADALQGSVSVLRLNWEGWSRRKMEVSYLWRTQWLTEGWDARYDLQGERSCFWEAECAEDVGEVRVRVEEAQSHWETSL